MQYFLSSLQTTLAFPVMSVSGIDSTSLYLQGHACVLLSAASQRMILCLTTCCVTLSGPSFVCFIAYLCVWPLGMSVRASLSVYLWILWSVCVPPVLQDVVLRCLFSKQVFSTVLPSQTLWQFDHKFNAVAFHTSHVSIVKLHQSINQSIKFYLYSPYSQTTVRLIGL